VLEIETPLLIKAGRCVIKIVELELEMPLPLKLRVWVTVTSKLLTRALSFAMLAVKLSPADSEIEKERSLDL
jgi:hypothetical protein